MKTIIDWKGQTVEFHPDECGKGWEKLLDKLYDDLVALGWDTELHQVKEKFGGLRFYIGYGSEEVYKRIRQAEKESEETCIRCGSPGKLRTEGRGWILTLCDECDKK